MEIEKNLATIEKSINSLIEFAVTYGFQIVGALVFLFIGLKLALWLGHKVAGMAEAKNLDVTLSKFVAGPHAIFRTAPSIPEHLCSRHSPGSIGRAMFFAEWGAVPLAPSPEVRIVDSHTAASLCRRRSARAASWTSRSAISSGRGWRRWRWRR